MNRVERDGWRVARLVAVIVAAPVTLHAQRGMMRYFGDPNEYYTPPAFHGNVKYDGRFTFARIKYRGYAHFTDEGPGWSHDYPRSDVHFMKIMREVTALYTCGPAGGGGVRTAITQRLNSASCLVPRDLVPATFALVEE